MDSKVFLFAAGALAGGMNAMAGGGSFIGLPALIAAGLPSVAANASSTVALYPGGVASFWVYRGELQRVCGVPLAPTLVATLGGGLAGALLLLWTPSAAFDRVLPWLLLLATLALAFGRRIGPALRRHVQAGLPTILVVQLVLGLYGGYFGGAVGLMMMAAWALLDEADLKRLNAPRTLMVTAANTVAMLCFALFGVVRWPEAIVMGIGALGGGFAGAHLGRRLPAAAVRFTTIVFAAAMTTAFFVRAYR